MAEATQKPLTPHALRLHLTHLEVGWVEGIDHPALTPYVGRRRRGSLKQVLDKLVDLVQVPSWTHEEPVRAVARACNLSPRTVGKKMRALEALGFVDRRLMGPAPPITYVRADRLVAESQRHVERRRAQRAEQRRQWAEDAEARTRALQTQIFGEAGASAAGEGARGEISGDGAEGREGAGRVGEAGGGGSPSGGPGVGAGERDSSAAPSPEERPVGEGDVARPEPGALRPVWGAGEMPPAVGAKERGRGKGAPPGRKTSPALASLIWNVEPMRPDLAEALSADARWPEAILTREARHIAQTIRYYCALCHLGGDKWLPKAPTVGGLHKHFWEVLQFSQRPDIPEPGVGRQLRSEAELLALREGRSRWAPAPLPARDPDDPRSQLLAPWLRSFYATHDDFFDRFDEALAQRGPPPDWLPEGLRPRWGSLPVFSIPI